MNTRSKDCLKAIQDYFSVHPPKYRVLAHADSKGAAIVYIYSESKGYYRLPLAKREEYLQHIQDRLAEIAQQFPDVRLVLG